MENNRTPAEHAQLLSFNVVKGLSTAFQGLCGLGFLCPFTLLQRLVEAGDF